MNHYDHKERRTFFIFILIFLLLVMGIVTSGYFSYRTFEQQFRTQAERQLSSIAELKVNELIDWRTGRLAEAEMIYQNHVFAALVSDYFKEPDNVLAGTQIQSWLMSYKVIKEYDHVRLLDVKGQTHITYPLGLPPLSSVVAGHIPEVLQSKQIMLIDFYLRDTDQQIRLSILIPILDPADESRVLGLVAISINPEVYLYPFIEKWPIYSTSAETLLIRREGNDVLFLNNLRFDSDAALALRFPLTETELPAVKAVLGQTGIVDGVDYRGEKVLTDLRPVPESPWFLASKIDTVEVYAPLRTRLWQTFGLAGMAILLAGTGLMVVWRQQRVYYYRTQANASEALRSSEKKYRALVENMQVGVVVHSSDTSILFSNPMATQLLGLTPDQMRGKTAIDPAWCFIREDGTRAPLEEYPVNRALNSDVPISNLVLGILRPERQEPTWVQCDAHQDREPDGRVRQIVVTFFDITERKQIQDLLSESEGKYRILTDRIADQFFGMDTSLRYSYWNKTSEKETGIAAEDALGKSLQEVFPDTAGSQIEKFFLDALKIQKSATLLTEYSILGRKKFFEITCYPSLEGLSVFSKDITERKRMEEALRESEEKFKYVFDNSVIGKSITLPSGEINVNKAFCDMLGYSRDELVNRKWQEISHPDDIEITQKIVSSLISGEKESARFTKRYIHKNGSVIWTDVGTAVRRDKDGKPLYFMTTVSDITERKQMEEELQANALLLDQAYDAIMVRNMESKLLFWNKGSERTYGWTKTEVLGKVTHTILHTIFPISREAVDQSLMSEGIWEGELIHTRIDGIRIVMLSRQVLQRDNQGRPIGILEINRDITERKLMEDALRESEDKWRSLVSITPDYIALHDQEGRFLFLNHYAEGYSEKDVIGNSVYEYILPESLEQFRTSFEKAMKSGVTQHIEHKAMGDHGTVRTYEDYHVPVRGKGQEINIMVVSRDITDRKQAEETLQASELRFRLAAENLTDVIYEWDLKERVDWYGDIDGMMGYPINEFPRTLTGWAALLHPDDRQGVISAIDNCLKGTAEYNVEYRIMNKEKDWRWWSARGSTLRTEQGEPYRWIGSISDITERKQADELLRHSEAELKVAQATAHIGNWEWDLKTAEIIWSDEMYRIFGIDKASYSGRLGDVIRNVVHPEDLHIVLPSNARTIVNEPIEYRILRADGSTRYIWAKTGATVYDQEGKPIFLKGVAQDVTERKLAEQQLAGYAVQLEEVVNERTRELRDTQEQLIRQEKLAILGQLAGSMAHELRNPLGVISNAIYFLKISQPDANDRIKEYLNIIENEARTSDKIITDLLDFARVKSVDRQPVSVPEVIHQTLNRFPVPPSVELVLTIPFDLPQIFADPHHMVQILGNLTVNACQALPDTGGRLEISVAVRQDMVSIAIHDNGTGISPENMNKLFEPLFTTKIKGIGLGLAVSRKLAEANGGRIEVKSEAGQGSTFTIFLPLESREL